MNCPLCKNQSKRKFSVDGFYIRDCESCEHRFTEIEVDPNFVKETYGDLYFEGGGAGYADYLKDKSLLIDRGNFYANILARNGVKTGRVMDIGAAAGFFLGGMRKNGWETSGVEPNAKMAEYGNRELGLRIKNASVEDFQTEERFDLVTLVQVIAHLRDPQTVLRSVSEILDDNGYLLIETWNRDSISARLFGTKWHEYSPPSVLHFYNSKRLNELAEQEGFELVKTGRTLKWISFSHAQSLIGHKLGMEALLTRFLNLFPSRWSIPYPSEDLFWVLYRKQTP